MVRRSCASFAVVIAVVTGLANRPASGAGTPSGANQAVTMPLYRGLGDVSHPVTTSSPLAQKYFDQGLAFTYGFNHYEAERSFEQAALLDPKMPMAYWGVALVLGPNYNMPQDRESGRRAFAAIKRAHSLEGNASAEERDLIEALSLRYGSDGLQTRAREQAYADAMRAVAHRYPGDLDVQTLFAESLMDLHPWQLWNNDGTPGVDTDEIVAVLESVLKRNPHHIGANHYYIHALEASPDPSRATASARRLAALAPGAGHLVHMPAHIYVRTGYFHAAAQANENAIETDRKFFAASKEAGMYPLVYYTHNIHFLCYCEMIEGRRADALRSARTLVALVPLDTVRKMPMAEFVLPVPYFVEARFGEWDAALAEPAPQKDLLYTVAMWHYVRGLAFSATGEPAQADRERKQLDAAAKAIPADRPLGSTNQARNVAELARALLAGEILSARGDRQGAIAKFTEAVRRQDALNYDEPPIWYFPVRERLGRELRAAARVRDAELVYREDLKKNPGNPRSLYGLARCLRAEGRAAEAAGAERQFRGQWRWADAGPE
jgi:tetratricopeptide (TPR) repeat protein